jgi:hypothetical protein
MIVPSREFLILDWAPVICEAGVDVAKARQGKQSLGTIAMSFLNDVVRPSLVAWHTSLSAHEAATWKRMIESGKPLPNNMELARALVDETSWEGYDTFHAELQELQEKLCKYVAIVGLLAGAAESPDVTQDGEE